jgi:hypothetical protein
MATRTLDARHDAKQNNIVSSEVLEITIILCNHFLRICVSLAVVFGVCIETLRISGPPDGRNDGASEASVVQVVPVHIAEEGLLLDPCCATDDVAQSPRPVEGAELANNVFRFW